MEKSKSTAIAIAEEHLARYATSGMTQIAYCTEYGINKATFAYWLKRKRDSERGNGFVQVSTTRKGSAMEVRLVDGTVVSFEGLVDVQYLRALIG